MVVYNLTNLTSSVNYAEQAQAINLLTNGMFGLLFLLTVLVVIFLVLRLKSDIDDFVLITFVLWIGIILGGMLKVLDLIPASVMITLIVLSFVSIIVLYAVKR